MIQIVPIDDLQRGEQVVVTLKCGHVYCGEYLGLQRGETVRRVGVRFWYDDGLIGGWFATEEVESVDRRPVELDPC